MTTTSGGSGGRSGMGTNLAIAAVFAIGATAVAAWQWSSYSRPRPNAKAEREARAAATKPSSSLAKAEPGKSGAAGDSPANTPGETPDSGRGQKRVVVGGPGSGPAGGSPGEVHAGSLDEAAKQLGTTPDALRERLAWMKPDAEALPDATFEYQPAKNTEQAATVKSLLISSIEKQAPAFLSWSTAPTNEAGELAKAASEALLGRIRGDAAYREMITKLGGSSAALPPADAAPKAGAALREALDGATIDPSKVRLRKGPSGEDNPMGMMPRGGPAGATMVMKNRMGDGPELTQMITPTGSLFPDTADQDEKKLHSVEVRVPLNFATVASKPGMSSLAVTMVHVKDGVWQPSQFALYVADDAASKALMPRRGQ